ncbi:olfactory receptor class A-like protein 1 [Ascaphus truei]|uniref:olfactory receptor class A-like protein 1 n=1 Tax=Ascaphus truei TaxID=8439 RepID=UPI003F5ADDCB
MYLLFKACIFIYLVVIGIPANIFMVSKFIYIKIKEKKFLPSNIILVALFFMNILELLSCVFIQALNSIGLEDLLNDRQCKLIIFTYRVSRAMSICVTSLLSCLLCVLIASATRKWNYLKQMVTRNLFVIIILLVLLGMNMSIYPAGILHGRTRSNATTLLYTLRLVYCDVDHLTYVIYITNGLVPVIWKILFLRLMTSSSSYMVFVLHRHGKSMKGMRSSAKGQSKTVEYKASRAIILLVAMYVALYGIDNFMWIYTLTQPYVNPDVNDTRLFLAASFSVLSPFFIFATHPKLQQGFKTPCKKRLLGKKNGV